MSRRWAIVRTVQSANFSLIASWMMLSVLRKQRKEGGRDGKKRGGLVGGQQKGGGKEGSGEKSSHMVSTLAVASSRTRILLLRRRALARHTNWRWPTLKLDPCSITSALRPPSICSTTSFSWTCNWKGTNGRELW